MPALRLFNGCDKKNNCGDLTSCARPSIILALVAIESVLYLSANRRLANV